MFRHKNAGQNRDMTSDKSFRIVVN